MRCTVAEHRERQKLTQAVLAEKVGISQSELSLVENGEREPNVKIALKLELILDVDVHKLFIL